MRDCNHQLFTEGSRLGCSRCNQYWRDSQALELLLNRTNHLQTKLLQLEEYIIDQYTSALGQLGLEPCLNCGEFILDLHIKKGWEPYHPQRRVVCDFGRKGIHIRVAGDCILCASCLRQRLTDNYFTSSEELRAIAVWMVRHFGDVRSQGVRDALAPTYGAIALAISPHITDAIIAQIRI
jgi:hypothetical protein